MKKIMLLTLISMLSTAYFAHAEALKAPTSKNDVKSFYSQIDVLASKLNKENDSKIIEDVLVSCLKAKKIEPNLFCLDSILEYYIANTDKVRKVAREKLSKDDSDFIIRRLDTLKSEAENGNDPSVY